MQTTDEAVHSPPHHDPLHPILNQVQPGSHQSQAPTPPGYLFLPRAPTHPTYLPHPHPALRDPSALLMDTPISRVGLLACKPPFLSMK